ncbi:type IV secretory system conjugative DNA transfer family protein [Brevifollis gellanilyticus]|nr:type IV secretion system DNA-binding domain-containing protein [Brevifollis gellanilyticus]
MYAVAEIGLARDCLLSIETGKVDLLPGLLAAMSVCEQGEMALFQVIFEPVSAPWEEGMADVSTQADGSSVFRNRPELPREAANKTRTPLYAVVIRLVACAETSERAWALLAGMTVSLNILARPGGNHLVPLALKDYPEEAQEEDILFRQSHRWGMLLSQEELLTLVTLPTDSIACRKLRQDTGRTRAFAGAAGSGLFLGWNDHAGARSEVFLTPEQRVRHMHVIGGTGTGKTTFLTNLIRQDIESGQGFALLDPHGDLVEKLLCMVPESRMDDVVLIDAGDEAHSVGFNILSAKADYEKALLASDLVSIFQRLSTSWGDQMAVVLRNAILAFLEHPEGGTLGDVQRFLLEPDFRGKVLEGVSDADVVYYWRKGFPLLGGSKSIGPVLTRLQTFLSPKPIRYMVAQRQAKLDMQEIMDSGKILLAKLPQGLMGADNSYLLGSLLVSKIQQTAMGRQRMPESQRRLFTLYVDEFQNFITPSMAEILSGGRKYRLSLVLAHQGLEQLGRNDTVGSAVLANAGTRVVFGVGDSDSRELAKGFAHFESEALQALSIGDAIARVERSDQDFNLRVPPPPEELPDEVRRDEVIARSNCRYATARAEIEAAERKRLSEQVSAPSPKRAEAKKEEAPMPAVEAAPPASQAAVSGDLPKEAENVPQTPVLVTEAAAPRYESTSLKDDLEELGRGGETHKAAQAECKRLAETRGFRATIERQLPDSLDKVDLYLERDGITIACEVSVTNTLEYEMRNITKCLRAGVTQVLVLAVDVDKHQRLSGAIASQLPPDQQKLVLCLMKDDFAAFLDSIPEAIGATATSHPAPEKAKMVKGWKVRTNTIPTTDAEVTDVEKQLAATMAENLRRRATKKRKKK